MRLVATLVLLSLAALSLAACTESSRDRGPIGNRLVRIVATTGMVADLARNVGGDRVEVEALMAPGVDPHGYKARESDLGRLRGADLVLMNGLYLEGKMAEVLGKLARSRPVVAVAEVVPEDRRLASEGGGGHPDPHVWFDVALWAEATGPVAEALASVDPDHADGYRERAAAYRALLLELDREVRDAIATIPRERRVLITSHDAFRYFGRAYDIDVAGIQGISTVLEAGVKDRQRIVDQILERSVKAIFVESSVAPRTIEAVKQDCAARGHAVVIGGTLYSDAMGDTAPDDTYPGMVRTNVSRIVEALR